VPTTFNWIYLGRTTVVLDPTEGNATTEDAELIEGTNWGSSGSPLYTRITSATMIDNGGAVGVLDTNNNAVNDQFTTNIGAGVQTFTYDGGGVYNITMTYADGTTATVTGVIVQSTTGDLFFAPEQNPNGDTDAQAAKPIVSIAIGTNVVSSGNFTADRAATGWDDGWVDGTAGNELINAAYVEPSNLGTDRIDNNDGINGNSMNDDRVRAGAGNDTVFSGLGNDLVYGGTGLDALYGEAGDDTLYGEEGDDGLFGGDNSDLLFGGSGADTLFGGNGSDTLHGGDNGDQLYGAADQDTLYGDAGNDSLFGDSGDDQLFGGADSDQLSGGSGLDTLFGGAAADTLEGNAGSDLLDGGADSDLIYGGADQDILFGDSENDILFGGSGNDALTGGTGADRIYAGDDRDEIFTGFDDVLGSEFVDGGSGAGTSSDNDTLRLDITGFGWGRIDLVYDPLNLENGTITFLAADGLTVIGTLAFTDIENLVIVCFTAGTKILTAAGQVAVEDLAAGDMVVTRDNGVQPLRWVGSRKVSLAELTVRPELQPVRIGAGALGSLGPERTMMLSPQHRVLIEGARAEMYFGECEVLIPAKHLVGLADVTRSLPAEGVVYVHLLFDRHEIVLSDGLWTESFQPAERTLSSLDEATRTEVLTLFPELALDVGAYPAARLSLKAHESRVLISG